MYCDTMEYFEVVRISKRAASAAARAALAFWGGGRMNIRAIELDALKPYANNPRRNDGAVDAVAASIREFGFKQPLVVDGSLEIVAGHTRYLAARKLGLAEAPCVMADDLTPAQIRAYRLADNKTHELSEWDFDLLDMELASLPDFDMSDFGFDMSELLESESTEIREDDFDVDANAPDEPITVPGDIWRLGKHRLMCGDCTVEKQVAALMDVPAADLVVTDPPYNVNYEGGTQDKLTIQNDALPDALFRQFLTKAFGGIERHLKAGGCFYIFHADSEGHNFRGALRDVGLTLRQCLVWVKNHFVLGRQDYQWQHEPILYGWKDGAAHLWTNDRKQTTLMHFDKPLVNAEHPTMKPVSLVAYLVSNNTKPGEIVLDAFGGSGSTLIACEQTGRVCYMMELDPKYCDVIVRRWEQFTGSVAEKI